MPNLTGQPAVDVAIGLFFLFFLLSVICSAINETITNALALRSEVLLTALQNMLKSRHDPRPAAGAASTPAHGTAATAPAADAPAPDRADLLPGLLQSSFIQDLTDRNGRRLRKWVPSYIPSRTFALALLDTLTDIRTDETAAPSGETPAAGAAAPAAATTPPADPADPANPANPTMPSASVPAAVPPASVDEVKDHQARADYDLLLKARQSVNLIEQDQVKKTLTRLLDDAAGDRQRFIKNIEDWFDATMDRASGWYKRRTVLFMWIIAAVLVLVLNADSFQVARGLWGNDTLRAAVVVQAQQATQQPAPTKSPDVGGLGADAKKVAAQIQQVKDLGLPLGWSFHQADPRWPHNVLGFLVKLVGLILTVVALSLGAPFWFDLLGRVSRLRTSGTPERPGAA